MLKASSTTGISKKLVRLGQINFINCLPINYALKNHLANGEMDFDFKLFDGAPVELNRMLDNGDLDLAPISSFEFLKNKNKYVHINGLSISSKQKADSVLFLSKIPLEELKTVYLTQKSATSANLLKIILKKKYGLKDLKFQVLNDLSDNSLKLDKSLDNKLLIGDEALLEDPSNYRVALDLGEEWYQLTELPMVFGLWAARKDFDFDPQLLELFKQLKDEGLNKYFPDVVINAFMETGIFKARLREYYNNLDYGFSEKHRKSLELFETYLKSEGLLD